MKQKHRRTSRREGQGMQFVGVRFYYVYCFVVDIGKFDPDHTPEQFEEWGLRSGLPTSRKGWLPTMRARTMIESQGFVYLDPGLPRMTEYEAAREDGGYYFTEPWTLVPPDDAPQRQGVLTYRISRLVRLRATGAGTVTLCVEAVPGDDAAIDYLDLGGLARLAPARWSHNEPGSSEVSTFQRVSDSAKADVSLDRLFAETMGWLEDRLGARPFFPEMLSPSGGGGLPEAFSGVHLPYVYSELLMDGESYKHCLDPPGGNGGALTETRPAVAKQIAALLLRTDSIEEFDRISMRYLTSELFGHETQERQLVSIDYDRDAFACITRSASVCICRQPTSQRAESLLRSLRDVIETARLRWHALMVSNLWLDYLLASLRADGDVDQVQLEAEAVREVVAALLGDPYSYLHDGHVGLDMMEIGYDRFRVNVLQRSVVDKLAVVESIAARKDYLATINAAKAGREESPEEEDSQRTLVELTEDHEI